MSVTTAQAVSLLQNVLFESATAAKANAASWVSLSNLNSSYSTVAGLASAMAQTAEATIAEQVIRYYEGALGRAPSGAEVAYYVNIVENGNTAAGITAMTASQILEGASAVPAGTWDKIASFFAASPEFAFASAGGNVVNLLYLNILGRAPNVAEVTYYQNLLAAGTTVSTLVQYFTTSPEYQGKVDTQIQANISAYGAVVAAGGTAPASVGTITSTAPVGTTTVLTTGVDNVNLTGSNNVVNGTANGTGATYTVGDQVIGAAGTTGNTLNLSDLTVAVGATLGLWNTVNLAGVTVSNIQTLNLTSGEAISVNTSTGSAGFSGLTSLSVVSVSGTGTATTNVDSVTAGATTAVKVSDTEGAATTAVLTVTGGSSVSVTENNGFAKGAGSGITVLGGSGTTSVSVTQTESATGQDQTVIITDKNEAGGTKAGIITSVTIDGLDSTSGATINTSSLSNLTINDVVGGATVAIVEGGYATPSTTLNLTLSNDTAVALTDAVDKTFNIIAGAKASTIAITDAAATTLNVSGASTVTLSGLTTLTTVAVSGAGGLVDTADFAASTVLTSVTDTSSGTVSLALNDTVTSFDGSKGTGQEVITITGDATKAITGGSGKTNEIIFNAASTTFTAAKSGANITGFTVLGTGAASTGTFDLSAAPFSGFKTIDVSASSTVAFTNVAAATAIAIDAGAVSVTDTQADSTGSSDTVALTLSTSSAGATVVGAFIAKDKAGAAVGTLTIDSEGAAGTVNTITALDAGVTGGISALTVSGSAGLVVSGWTDAAATVVITNNSSGTASSSFTLTDNTLTSLTYAGTNAATAGSTVVLSDSVLGGVTFTDSSAGAVTLTATLANATSLVINDSSAKGLSITDIADANLTTLTLNNTGTGTLVDGSTALGIHGAALATINLTGTGKETVNLTNSYTGTLTINDTDTAAVTVNFLDATSGNLLVTDSGANLTFAGASTSHAATVNFTNTGTGTVTVAGLTDNLATTLNLVGKTSISLTDSLAGAVTVTGDNANDTVTLVHNSAAAQTDTITLGNGTNSLVLTGSQVANIVNITVGTGADTITLVAAHTGVDTITVGANAISTTALTAITNNVVGDVVVWANNATNTVVYGQGAVASVAAGLAGIVAADGYNTFSFGGNTYVYENTGSAATSTLVELVGVHAVGVTSTVAHLVVG